MIELTELQKKIIAEDIRYYDKEAVMSLCKIMYEQKKAENPAMKSTRLESINDYAYDIEARWYLYETYEALIESEIEQGTYGFTMDEIEEQIGKTIFELRNGWFAQVIY
ncbi:MAG: hypothetical protein LBM69_00095 [Lachnospiraceae bacterium]|jgi:hypothetical protein|nr:hypothetical protein [Lachnospiraceae bacterium]